MFKRIKNSFLLFSLIMVQGVFAAPAIIPSGPQIAAKGYILIDAASGKVILEKNADERLEPASLTKLMTAYVAEYELQQGNIHLDDKAHVSENAWAKTFQGSSLMFIEVGKKVAVSDLLKGVIISSGNDASVALAEHIAGSSEAFAEVMNKHAVLLGLKNSHFVNPHGLPHPEHYVTARDMATLARAIIRDFPEPYKLYAEKSFIYNNIQQPNRNRLLWLNPAVDGLKTGHTETAGWCLVSSAVKDGVRLISVVMGASSDDGRMVETEKLLSFGFRYYTTLKLYNKGQNIQSVRLWGGAREELSLVAKDDVYLTVPIANKGDVKAEIELDKYIEAPVQKGQQLGSVVVKLGDTVLLTQPVVASESVEEGDIVDVVVDKISMFIDQMLED